MSAPIATHSGLRGKDLSTEDVQGAVGGFLSLVLRGGLGEEIGLASDGRPGNDELCAVAIEEASARGFDIVDLGIVSTPTAKIASASKRLAGAVIVTASHLPHGWNGVKLVIGPHYFPVDIGALPDPGEAGAGRRGTVRRNRDAARIHAEAVVAAVDADAIRAAAPSVALSGGAGDAAPIALEMLGCKLAEGGADAGLALDADGDRLALTDERGIELDEEVTFALATVGRGEGTVVKGADTSRMIDDLIAARGGQVRIVAPGELHLVEEVLATGASLAGEGNGGVVYPRVGLARDGLSAAALVLELVARRESSLSQLEAELPRYARRRSRIDCPRSDAADAALAALAREYRLSSTHDPRRGVELDRAGCWAMVRRSATEPVLRLTVEGDEEDAVGRLHDEIAALVGSAMPGGDE